MTKPTFVAELTINHLGMVGIAKAMIAAAKKAGADYVKLKTKNVEKYYDDSLPDWRNFPFRKYRQSLELSPEDFAELDAYCKSLDIPWFSTIHDQESLDFIRPFNPPFYKIASMDIGKSGLFDAVVDACKQESKPLVASVGGKTLDHIEALINRITDAGIAAHILHTVSIYPTPPGRSNINFLSLLKAKFETGNNRISFGYSGHESGYAASVLAGLRGATMIERHFTLSRDFKIHHMDAAITPEEFQQMIRMIREMSAEASADVKDVDAAELRFLENLDYSRYNER